MRSSRTNTPKKVLFIIVDWNAKEGSQEIPGGTVKFGLGVQNEAEQRLTEFCQEKNWYNKLVYAGKAKTVYQQYKRQFYTWASAEGQYQSQTDYILCSQIWRIYNQQKQPGAGCGSDYELLTAKFRLKLKKVGKTIRPFRYDLNQIPYD